MRAKKTRELIDKSIAMAMGNIPKDNKLLHELCEKADIDLNNIERLAEIGRATEKAFKNHEYCIASYKGNHLRAFKTLAELVEWAESEGE